MSVLLLLWPATSFPVHPTDSGISFEAHPVISAALFVKHFISVDLWTLVAMLLSRSTKTH